MGLHQITIIIKLRQVSRRFVKLFRNKQLEWLYRRPGCSIDSKEFKVKDKQNEVVIELERKVKWEDKSKKAVEIEKGVEWGLGR